MLNIDPARVGARQVAQKLLVGGRRLIRVFSEEDEEPFGPGAQPCDRELFCILLCLFREDDAPSIHQPGSSEHSSIGVSRPSRIDSRIPGKDSRYTVS